MEEKKQQAQPKRLSYDELKQIAGNLEQSNRRLLEQVKQMQDALERRDFDYSSFFLSMLFKVMDHPECYGKEFVAWVVDHIQGALQAFAAAMYNPQESEKPEVKKNEAE